MEQERMRKKLTWNYLAKVARFSLFPSLNYTGQLMQAGEPYGAGRNRKGSSAAVERVFINFFEGHSTR